VEGEERGGEPGAGNGEAAEEGPEEKGVGGVEEQIDGVVAGLPEGPEMEFEPPGGVGEGVVLGFGPGVDPNAEEAGEGAKMLIEDDVGFIIPEEAALKDGPERDEDEERQGEGVD
jgi:hypothetical protein